MLKEDYLLSYIHEELEKGTNAKLIVGWLGLDSTILDGIQMVYDTGEFLGDILVGDELLKFYKSGLTYSEIARLKGVTNVAIRLSIKALSGENLAAVKEENRENRRKLRDVILYRKIWVTSEVLGFDEAKKRSGYSDAFFKQRYRLIKKQMMSKLG